MECIGCTNTINTTEEGVYPCEGGHVSLCLPCLTQWIKRCMREGKNVTCPLCRGSYATLPAVEVPRAHDQLGMFTLSELPIGADTLTTASVRRMTGGDMLYFRDIMNNDVQALVTAMGGEEASLHSYDSIMERISTDYSISTEVMTQIMARDSVVSNDTIDRMVEQELRSRFDISSTITQNMDQQTAVIFSHLQNNPNSIVLHDLITQLAADISSEIQTDLITRVASNSI